MSGLWAHIGLQGPRPSGMETGNGNYNAIITIAIITSTTTITITTITVTITIQHYSMQGLVFTSGSEGRVWVASEGL